MNMSIFERDTCMKPKLFFFSVILISQFAASAQNYLDYHREILQAEKLFFVRQFDSSIHSYKKIFTKYSKPFAKDCYIALQFAAMRKDTASATLFFMKAFENGVRWNDLSMGFQVRELLGNAEYKKRISLLYPIYRQKYLHNINYAIRDSVEQMIVRDNQAGILTNQAFFKSKIHRNNKLQYEVTDTAIVHVYDRNLAEIIRISKRYGFPGQHLIGLLDPELEQHDIREEHFELITLILLYHHYCSYFFLKNELLTALKNGELLPTEYAMVYQWSYDAGYYNKNLGKPKASNTLYHFGIQCDYSPPDKIYNHFTNPWYYSKDSAFVNKCRSEIGMQSLQHEMAKKMFARRNDIVFDFGYMNTIQ